MPEAESDGLSLLRVPLTDPLQVGMLDEIKRNIATGKVVILKGAVEQARALLLRDLILAWKNTRDVVDFSVDTNAPGINFHRIDADPAKSQLPHLFHQYGFGAITELPADLRNALQAIGGQMLNLQNAVAETEYNLDMPEIRIKALQYPRGGGFLANHAHPIRPQGVGLILALSKAGTDFTGGGTTFVTPLGKVDTSQSHDLGDLILFRYDLEHAVTPIDKNEPLDWSEPGGRWTLVLELLTTHARSEAT